MLINKICKLEFNAIKYRIHFLALNLVILFLTFFLDLDLGFLELDFEESLKASKSSVKPVFLEFLGAFLLALKLVGGGVFITFYFPFLACDLDSGK